MALSRWYCSLPCKIFCYVKEEGRNGYSLYFLRLFIGRISNVRMLLKANWRCEKKRIKFTVWSVGAVLNIPIIKVKEIEISTSVYCRYDSCVVQHYQDMTHSAQSVAARNSNTMKKLNYSTPTTTTTTTKPKATLRLS